MKICARNVASGLLQIGHKLEKWEWRYNLLTWRDLQFFFFFLFGVTVFLLSSLVTSPSFMSKLLLVLQLWQFSVIGDWPEIWKSEIPLSEFCPISGDLDKLEIQNLAKMSLMKSYWMLQNARLLLLPFLSY